MSLNYKSFSQNYLPKDYDCNSDTCVVSHLIDNYRSLAHQNPDSAISTLKYCLKVSRKNNNIIGEINSLRLFADAYSLLSRYDTALFVLEEASRLALKANDLKSMARIYNLRGNIFLDKGSFNSSLRCYNRALEISDRINFEDGIVKAYANLGVTNYLVGNYDKAIDFYNLAIPRLETRQDSNTLAIVNSNLATFYQLVGDYDMAIDVCKKSLSYLKETDNLGKSTAYVNLGRNYSELFNYKRAIEYYKIALELSIENGNVRNMITCYNNIGISYVSMGQFNKGVTNLDKGLKMAEKHGMDSDVAQLKFFLAKAYLDNGEISQATSLAEESSRIADSLKIMELMFNNYMLLADLYEQLNDFQLCNEVLKKHIEINQEVQDEYYHHELSVMEAKYKVDIKEQHIKMLVQDSLYKQQVVSSQEKELKWKKAETNYLILGGLLLFLGTLLITYFLLQYKKVNKYIVAQKEKVELQKKTIEIKNRDITDSIKYAERIQKTILPAKYKLREYLPDSFVLYKPKDFVAGDFYWLEKNDSSVMFAVADCTGHGVPGAIVSVVCHNALNRSVRQYGLTAPNQILDMTKSIVVDEFSKNEDVRDGMDIALCALSGNKLHFSGANNPLWLVRKGVLTAYKPDKQPVGKYEINNPFTNHEIELQKNDMIYIFSDGFSDQFGGEKGKKYMAGKFKKLLISISELAPQKQRMALEKEFNEWKGNQEQIDDVCVIGFRR
ncbi:MAG: tetratricopeptide repeat protein [Flavobacteriales bacterium]|nr:tetratricopeptide repeat protein [Flavobacteriales bacterium]